MKPESRERIVREYFGQSSVYLAANDGIKVRAEVVADMCSSLDFNDIADLACGNGLISIQLLNEERLLTLLDISPAMAEAARKNIAPAFRDRVSILEAAIENSSLKPASYDLVLCLGLLAHLSEPMRQLRKNILPLLREGGYLIIQNTDNSHPYTWISHHLASTFRRMIGREPYALQRISQRQLRRELDNAGYKQLGSFSYIVSFPLLGRLMAPGSKHKLIKRIFGSYKSPRLQWLGNDSVYLMKKER